MISGNMPHATPYPMHTTLDPILDRIENEATEQPPLPIPDPSLKDEEATTPLRLPTSPSYPRWMLPSQNPKPARGRPALPQDLAYPDEPEAPRAQRTLAEALGNYTRISLGLDVHAIREEEKAPPATYDYDQAVPGTWLEYLRKTDVAYLVLLDFAERFGGMSRISARSDQERYPTNRDLVAELFGQKLTERFERLYYRGYPGDLSKLGTPYCEPVEW